MRGKTYGNQILDRRSKVTKACDNCKKKKNKVREELQCLIE